MLAGSWAYDPGTSVRSEGHPGLTVDGNNATCYITKVYNNPWVRIEIGNKDGKTHGKLFVVNQVQIVKCQGQKCAGNTLHDDLCMLNIFYFHFEFIEPVVRFMIQILNSYFILSIKI